MTRHRKPKTFTTSKPLIELSEEEQLRLVNQSGIWQKVNDADKNGQIKQEDSVEPIPFAEEILNALVYLIPFTFLLLMMEILIHYQYRKQPTIFAVVDRMISGVPILSIFIFYTIRYKSYRQMQIVLLVISLLAGSRLIYMINYASWLKNMQQCPPLATIWIYTIVQLDLGPAVVSLITTGSFVWYKGWKIIF